MATDRIVIKGARQHNLKNIDLELPRDQLIVFTGLSGSGKSSLAFDTIYAEGQRRYVESLSAYARQFLGQMDKPDVDNIEGLSPAISIDQKTTSRNPRSTVGTVTEVYDYLRLLYARIGRPHCPKCGQPIAAQTVQQMVDQVMALPEGTRLHLLAPLVRGRKGEHQKVLEDIRAGGFVRVRVDGEVREAAEDIRLDKNRKHTIEAVVDRIVLRADSATRLADSLEIALNLTGGLAMVSVVPREGETPPPDLLFSQNYACPDCGISIEELAPRMFSFNSPYGACPTCSGLGSDLVIDPELVAARPQLTLAEGAIPAWQGGASSYYPNLLEAACRHFGIPTDVPWQDLSDEHRETILYGGGAERITFRFESFHGRMKTATTIFEGVIRNLERRHRESTSEAVRESIEGYMAARPCPACQGARLRPEVLAVTVGGRSIAAATALSVLEAQQFFASLQLTEREQHIARQILKEIGERLGFLVDVGLDYLTLDRAAGTLSGGEAQRIRLATQIGSYLVGVLYILDEPSIGLHQRDNERLLATLARLRDLGNTLIVVEHDEDTMFAADYVVDIGPGAGVHGGEVVATGTVAEIQDNPASITGQFLSGRRQIPIPAVRRPLDGRWLEVRGARAHNLKNIDVQVPLGVFTCVTGVSGSGKSTLVNEIIYKALAAQLNRARTRAGEHDRLTGLDQLEKVIEIDQQPIGRTPRSNPATYTGVFDLIREVYASTPEAKMRGYRPGRFSFNVRGGRCEACRGDGIIKIEMHFLPDVYVPCEVCKGARYNRETLEVKYRGKSIADVLNMTVEAALEFFRNIPRIQRRLQTIADVGLGYIRLGQPATQLSGGEAQRVKLSTELSRRSNGRTFYILDEPTTGLHVADIEKLLEVLHRLVDSGDTVLVIEHNLDVIKTADHLIDLGPEGGDRGGTVVATGTPEAVAACAESHTGRFLRRVLARQQALAAGAEQTRGG